METAEHIALVDGDILPYKVGYAVEQSEYETEDGEFHATPGKAKQHCEANGLDPAKIAKYTEAEPLNHALYLVRNILRLVEDKTGASEIRVYLSGKRNFREKVATIKPYKGNRPAGKPLHHAAIRKYLIKQYNAEVVEDIEADDALGIAQFSSAPASTTICTIDKDLNMIPGRHYNWDKNTLYSVGEYEAIRNFYMQLCTGDSTDNIQGIPNIGPKGAETIVDGCKTEQEMFYNVLAAYREHGLDDGAFVETGQLIWIQRKKGDIWTPPFPLDEDK
jgi:hypothetical protein